MADPILEIRVRDYVNSESDGAIAAEVWFDGKRVSGIKDIDLSVHMGSCVQATIEALVTTGHARGESDG